MPTYKVVTLAVSHGDTEGYKEFERMVNYLLRNGGTLVGGVSVTAANGQSSSPRFIFTQAVMME